jgi:DNA excision repair protein ERCC-6
MRDRPKRYVDIERLSREQTRKETNKERKKIEDISLLEFIRQTVEMMVVVHSGPFARPPPQSMNGPRLASQNLEAVRYDSGRHIIFKSELHGVCKACKKRTIYRCERCEVALHPDCFSSFHRRDED